MIQSPLGKGVQAFLDSIPENLRPIPELFSVFYKAAQGNLTPQKANVIATCLGAANFYQSQPITGPRTLTFPQDHGLQLSTANEWYFLVSNLKVDPSQGGGNIAVVTMMMRYSAVSPVVAKQLGWTPLQAQLMDANLAVTFVTEEFKERVIGDINCKSGLSGDLEFSYDPFKAICDFDSYQGTTTVFPLVSAYSDEAQQLEVSLEYNQIEPLFLQGYNGYIPIDPGKSGFLYYSWAQLQTSGTISFKGITYNVTGVSWMDHQWGGPAESSSAISQPGIRQGIRQQIAQSEALQAIAENAAASYGWTWFNFQFTDGSAITFVAPHGYPEPRPTAPLTGFGKYIAPETGQTIDIAGHVLLTDFTQSPTTGAYFPTGWTLSVSTPNNTQLALTIVPKPWLKDQFGMFASLQEFWEGGVDVVAFDLTSKPAIILNGVGFCEGVGFETPESYVKRVVDFLES